MKEIKEIKEISFGLLDVIGDLRSFINVYCVEGNSSGKISDSSYLELLKSASLKRIKLIDEKLSSMLKEEKN